jgi:V8-like Glu-specific endopeptidase
MRLGLWGKAGSAALLAALLAVCWLLGAADTARAQSVAPASSSAGSALVHSAAPSSREARRVARYWTSKRMRQAVARSAILEGRKTASAGRARARASAIHAPVIDPTTYPFRIHGKVFLTLFGFPSECSATVVSSPSRRLVFTAGHCVNDRYSPLGRNRWAANWLFVPAYHDGQAPFGEFPAESLAAPKAWTERSIGAILPGNRFLSSFKFDVGAALLHPNGSGQTVEDAVGGASLLVDQSRQQQFQAFGYPGGALKGKELRVCASPYLGSERFSNVFAGPRTMKIACDMATGASGGGVMIQNGTALNGVLSFALAGKTENVFSPYFGGAIGAFYQQVGGF